MVARPSGLRLGIGNLRVQLVGRGHGSGTSGAPARAGGGSLRQVHGPVAQLARAHA